MPCAAAFDAPVVSSDKCAEASNPVIVYCVRITPSGTTYRKNFRLLVPPEKPQLLIQCVKTNEALWCELGAKIRNSTTPAAPATCGAAEPLFQYESTWLGKRLMNTWIA